MANRAHGLPDSIVKLHFKLLQTMVYEIQIAGAQQVQFKNEPDNLCLEQAKEAEIAPPFGPSHLTPLSS
jgi:hypothetical protein